MNAINDVAAAGSADPCEFAVLSGVSTSAMVETDTGLIPMGQLAVGNRVQTRDAGLQPVRWIARTPLSMQHLRLVPEMAPVRIPAGVLGRGKPKRDVTLSPSQLVNVTGPSGLDVLVTADTLGEPIYPKTQDRADVVTYMNVLLDGHHLIAVDGLWTGSLFTADLGLDADHPVAVMPMMPAAPILDRAAAMPVLRKVFAALA